MASPQGPLIGQNWPQCTNLMHLCVYFGTCMLYLPHGTSLATVWSRVKEPFGTCTGTEVLARRRRVPANRLAVIVDYTSLLQTTDTRKTVTRVTAITARSYISVQHVTAARTWHVSFSRQRYTYTWRGFAAITVVLLTALVQRYSSYSDYSGPGRGSSYKL